MPSASAGDTTSYSIERVAARESTSKAAVRSRLKLVHRFQSGRKASQAATSMNVAKASFSQMPFHHFMVTRSPNHMWASSWDTTSAIRWRSCCVPVSSTSSAASRNVMQPGFSMAPKAKSGRATRSSFFSGYGMP